MDPIVLTGCLKGAHLIGITLAGGASLMCDAIFAVCLVRFGGVGPSDVRIIRIGEKLIWSGLPILVIAGLLLFQRAWSSYINNDLFLVKIVIATIIIANGVLISRVHIPALEAEGSTGHSSLMLASGAVSIVSWPTALVLGTSLHSGLGSSSILILCVYLAVIVCVFLTTQLIVKRLPARAGGRDESRTT